MKNVHNGNRHQKDGTKVQHFWNTTGRLLTYLKPWKWGVIISILVAIASVVFQVMAPKVLGEVWQQYSWSFQINDGPQGVRGGHNGYL